MGVDGAVEDMQGTPATNSGKAAPRATREDRAAIFRAVKDVERESWEVESGIGDERDGRWRNGKRKARSVQGREEVEEL